MENINCKINIKKYNEEELNKVIKYNVIKNDSNDIDINDRYKDS